MRRRTLLAALGAALAGIGATCGEPIGPHENQPKDPGQAPPPADAPKDWNVGEYLLWGMAISIWMEPEACPYEVTIAAHDATAAQDINVISSDKQLGHEVKSGQFVVPVAYPAHDQVTLSIHVVSKGKQRPVKGYVAVREGPRPYTKSQGFNGASAVILEYHTQRA